MSRIQRTIKHTPRNTIMKRPGEYKYLSPGWYKLKYKVIKKRFVFVCGKSVLMSVLF